MRPSAPDSRNPQAISRITRAHLRAGAIASSKTGAASACTALSRAAATMVFTAAIASGNSLEGSSTAGGSLACASRAACSLKACRCCSSFWAASELSIRATASSTMAVSALRLRRVYSSRNQRPRAVSRNASRIASKSASVGDAARAEIGDRAKASLAMKFRETETARVDVVHTQKRCPDTPNTR